MAAVTWEFVATRLPSLPWSAVQFGIEEELCTWRLAVGRAEWHLATGSDERVIRLAICTDAWGARDLVAKLAADDAPEVSELAQRVWQFLALAWVAEGHPEPGADPAPRGSDRGAVLESVWSDFGASRELAFLIPWMPPEPGSRRHPPSDRPWWEQVDPQLRAWIAAEREELTQRLAD